MGQNVAQKLIGSHLADGEMTAGSEIGLRIDQTLTQDATGTMVMLELEALGLDRVRAQVSVQYVDYNLLQADERNMADHLFLRSACQRFGVWYSRPGNGVSHPVHMQRFGRPGASLAGSDSHTCAAGSLGMLAIGVGGLAVAMAMAGELAICSNASRLRRHQTSQLSCAAARAESTCLDPAQPSPRPCGTNAGRVKHRLAYRLATGTPGRCRATCCPRPVLFVPGHPPLSAGDHCRPSGPDGEGQARGQARNAHGEPPQGKPAPN